MTSATSTDDLTSVADQVREATEKSMQAWQQGTTTLTEQVIAMMTLPVDLTKPVELYLRNVQRTVDLQREMTYVWTDLLAQLSGSLRQQANSLHNTPSDNVAEESRTLSSRRNMRLGDACSAACAAGPLRNQWAASKASTRVLEMRPRSETW